MHRHANVFPKGKRTQRITIDIDAEAEVGILGKGAGATGPHEEEGIDLLFQPCSLTQPALKMAEGLIGADRVRTSVAIPFDIRQGFYYLHPVPHSQKGLGCRGARRLAKGKDSRGYSLRVANDQSKCLGEGNGRQLAGRRLRSVAGHRLGTPGAPLWEIVCHVALCIIEARLS